MKVKNFKKSEPLACRGIANIQRGDERMKIVPKPAHLPKFPCITNKKYPDLNVNKY